jgi:hypothetical protein
MKNLFVCFLLFTSLSSYSQFAPPEKVDAIDLKLDKFRKTHNTGTIIQIVGGLIAAYGLYSQQNGGERYRYFYATGGFIVVAGTLTKLSSYSHLRLTETPVKKD